MPCTGKGSGKKGGDGEEKVVRRQRSSLSTLLKEGSKAGSTSQVVGNKSILRALQDTPKSLNIDGQLSRW